MDLHPHPVAVAANDSASIRRFLVVAEGHLVGRSGIEVRVVGPGAVRDPALNDQVASDLVGVVAKVVALSSHAR
jgi:hypothetical protein